MAPSSTRRRVADPHALGKLPPVSTCSQLLNARWRKPLLGDECIGACWLASHPTWVEVASVVANAARFAATEVPLREDAVSGHNFDWRVAHWPSSAMGTAREA